MRKSWRVLITSEHGGNRVPREYAHLFRGRRRLLESHRGWDVGSLELARDFARALNCELISTQTTRLLVEPNRSLHHPNLFSNITRPLPQAERARIVRRYYAPHRQRVEDRLRELMRGGSRALHLSVHSFTPVLNGERRTAEIGLLYDPARGNERRFCAIWREEIRRGELGALRIRRNYPYRGAADGLTTSLRKALDSSRYVGIELEVNARLLRRPLTALRALHDALAVSLVNALSVFEQAPQKD